MPKVSIVVPVYKVENYLTQCLQSIVKQTLQDIEIIIVDEGDMDRCREIIDTFAERDPRIVTLHEKHGGYGNSVNAGIERATGEYIGIVESDDFISPEMYELLYQKARGMNAQVMKTAFYHYNGKKCYFASLVNVLCMELPTDKTFTIQEFPVLMASHPSVWAALYETAWLKNSGIRFLPKGAYLDVCFRFETLMAAQRIGWCDTVTYYWRVNNPTSTTKRWNVGDALERWEFLHGYFADKPELWKKFAPYMLLEESKNLFKKYDFAACSGKQRGQIRKYHALYPAKVIHDCPYVSKKVKDEYLQGNLDLLALRRALRPLRDKLWRKSAKTFSLCAWFSVIALLGVLQAGWLEPVLGRVNGTLCGLVAPVVAVVTVLYFGYWTAFIGLAIMRLLYQFWKKVRRRL